MTAIESLPLLATIALAALLCAGLTSAIKPLLQRYALARPNARSSHRVPTPQGGGIAVVAATIIAAEYDPLVGEERTYAKRLREAGVPLEMREWPKMPHGFYVMSAIYPEATDAMEYAAARLREAFAA